MSAHELRVRLAAARHGVLAAEAAVDSELLRLERELQAVRLARYARYIDPLTPADFDRWGRPQTRKTDAG